MQTSTAARASGQVITSVLVALVMAASSAGCGSTATRGQAGNQPAASAEAATTKEQFMPILERSYQSVEWPSRYTLTPDQVWKLLDPGTTDIAYGQNDADMFVWIWNACAWTEQLVDMVKGQTDPTALAGVESHLTRLASANDGNRPYVTDMVAAADLGDLSSAQQFIASNDCARGFP